LKNYSQKILTYELNAVDSNSNMPDDDKNESWKSMPPYGGHNLSDKSSLFYYKGACHCQSVKFEVRAPPVDAKICHCKDCQTLHGAPMQWAAIFHKTDVRITSGHDNLAFYDSATETLCHSGRERTLPCKVSCKHCRSPIADEGRRMWLAFPTLFDFGYPPKVPKSFLPSCHIFYGNAALPVNDGLPRYSGHKGKSPTM